MSWSDFPPQARRAARAFTILEILLALAIIGLLAGALIGASAHLLDNQPTSPEQIFWQSVQAGRKQALHAEHEIRLQFDKEKKAFVLVDGLAPTTVAADGFTREQTALQEFPIPPANAVDLEVNFLLPTKGGPMIMLGGVAMEAQTVPFVTFYPDGTCTAFRVQFVHPDSVGLLAVDPWTCAQVLTPADQKNTP